MMRKHLDHYASKLSASILAADTTCAPNTLPAAPPAGYYYPMQLQNDPVYPTEFETVWVTDATGGVVTIVREAENASTNPAQDWLVDEWSAVWLVSVGNAQSFDEVNGALIVSSREKIGTPSNEAVSISNGPWQVFSVTENVTMSFPDLPIGGCVTIDYIGDLATYVVSFPAGLWKGGGGPPDISSATLARFIIERGINSQLLFTHIGNYA